MSQGSRTAILSGGLHSLDSILFSEEEVQAERGHGCGPAPVAAVTQSGALSRGLGLQQPGLATWPDPLGWGVGCTERTQASPVLYPSCCLFLYLLVLGSCSPHLPQDQGQTHLSGYGQRDRSEWPAPVSIAAVNRGYFCQELQRTVFQPMFITTVKGRTQLVEMWDLGI